MAKSVENLNGMKFGFLSVISDPFKIGRRYFSLCKCFCGVEKNILNENLKRKNSQSCGCSHKNFIHKTHGLSKTVPEYSIWTSMRQRCNNPKARFFGRYGGRGIKVCAEWESFEKFYRDMGPRPSLKHSINRIDNEKGYSKENCEWATSITQMNNMSSCIYINYKGKTNTISQWSEIYKINETTLWRRLKKWPIDRALTEPININKRNKSAKLE